MMFGILGHNIAYTASPLLHRILAEISGQSIDYSIFDIEPDLLHTSLSELFTRTSGINVTIPYKETILDFLQSADQAVYDLKACNTVSIKNGVAHGANTDIEGIRATFRLFPELLAERTPVIIGNGGSARALIYTLAKSGYSTLYIVTRDPAKLSLLQREFRQFIEIRAITVEEPEPRCWINATPVGSAHSADITKVTTQIAALVSPDDALFDLNYRPQITGLQHYFRQVGVTDSVNGMPMLIGQAAASRKIWFPDFSPDFIDYQAITDRIYHG